MNNANANKVDKQKRSIYRELAELAPDTVLSESGLAELMDKHPASIKRAVERGELPPPTRLMGCPVWTVRAIIDHIETRLADEMKRHEELQKTVKQFQPRAD